MKQIKYSLLILTLFLFSCDSTEICLIPNIIGPIDGAQVESIRPTFFCDTTLDGNQVYLVETSVFSDFASIYESISQSGFTFPAQKVYPHDKTFYWRVKTLDCEESPKEAMFKTQSFIKFLSGKYQNSANRPLLINQNNADSIGFASYCGKVVLSLNDLEYWNHNELKFYKEETIHAGGSLYKHMEIEVLYDVNTNMIHIEQERHDELNGYSIGYCYSTFSGIKL